MEHTLVELIAPSLALLALVAMMSSASQGGARNHLAAEKSPYLLQHATNPVDWYPWGPEAFERARAEDKPIFLSIGYSTCHWCHVMERESFEDDEVAALMNEAFVCVKVDREERPDIDAVYMEAARLMAGGGGWPLTIIMTPERRPFYAATYLPRTRRFGRPGMMELVPHISKLWATRREDLVDTAGRVASALRDASEPAGDRELDRGTMDEAYRQLVSLHDADNGGFGSAPKFPTPHQLMFLLRYWHRTGETEALAMVEATLRAMRRGGIYDHVGFGFHRYSTDAEWLLPHFEKMLYDQAMLTMAFTEAYLATGDRDYERTAREIVTYVLRDMTDEGGAFYSAEDADSEGVEGKCYVWTMDELGRALSADEARLAAAAFGVAEEGNFPDETTQRRTGANVLHYPAAQAALAKELGLSKVELRGRLEVVREKLFGARAARVRPHLDDKVLTDWNGLMIAALARAAKAFDEPAYAAAASRCADFLMDTMRDGSGRLLHRYRDGDAAIAATADDYAFLSLGLFDLYEATHNTRYLAESIRLTEEMLAWFWDDEGGGFYFTPSDGETLLARRKETYDGAVPAANSVALLNLLRLGGATARPELEQRADELTRALSGTVERYPSAYTMLLASLDYALGPSMELVVAGAPDDAATRGLLKTVRRGFHPNTIVLLRPPDGADDALALAPWMEHHTEVDGVTAAYVCVGHQCRLPVTTPDELKRQLRGADPTQYHATDER
jgi:uncharacterized protein YyaL (SSP411 family)